MQKSPPAWQLAVSFISDCVIRGVGGAANSPSKAMKQPILVFLSLSVITGIYCHPPPDDTPTPPSRRIEVYKAGDLGYECFRIPSLLFTSKGTLLAFAEGRGQHSKSCADRGDVHIVLKRSIDNGNTWSDLTVVHMETNHTIGRHTAAKIPNAKAVSVRSDTSTLRRFLYVLRF